MSTDISEAEVVDSIANHTKLSGIRSKLLSRNINTIYGMYENLVRNYPLNSEEYNTTMEILREEYFRPKYGDEYVLVIPKKHIIPHESDYTFFDTFGSFDQKYMERIIHSDPDAYRMTYIRRSEAELNPKYVQVICCALLKCKDNKYIILRRKYGQFKDKLTLVMGHCAYEPSTYSFINYLFSQPCEYISEQKFRRLMSVDLTREIFEEVELPSDTTAQMDISEPSLYVPPAAMDPSNIAYYHLGFVYTMKLSCSSLKAFSGERELNDAIIGTEEALSKLKREDTDGWLYDYLYRIGIIERP